MRHLFSAAVLIALFASPSFAQGDFPLLEISLGYGNLGLTDPSTGVTSHHSGFVSQQEINLSRWYGIDNYVGYFSLGNNATAFSNIFGGRLIARSPKGYAVYGVAGLGWSRISLQNFSLGSMAAARVGGGVDIPINFASKIRFDATRLSFHTGNGGGSGSSWQSGMSYSGGLLLILQ
jgi:hypothetical protein